MKTATVVTIICWALIALVLIGVLVAALAGGIVIGGVRLLSNGLSGLNVFGGNAAAVNSSVSETGTELVAADGINKIKIDWIDGRVELVYHEGNEIKLEQKCITSIPENKKLRFTTDGSELKIYEGTMSGQWGLNLPATSLTLYVPKSLAQLDKLDIDSVSGEVEVCSLYANELDIDTTSGSIKLNGTCGSQAELGSVSGSITASASTFVSVDIDETSGAVAFEGSVNTFETDSISGAIVLKSAVCPNQVKVDTVSGGIQLFIPEGTGFTAKLDSVSGSASCTFPVTMASNDQMTYLNGGAVFHCSSVSGSLMITKLG